MKRKSVSLVECPRDAMQGITTLIPAAQKVIYLNHLLAMNFDTLDCGSFVSPKAIPQMADTKEVLTQLHLENTRTKRSVIVANRRGAEEAVQYDQVDILGFPFSISETFQQRNTNSSITESVQRLEEIQNLCVNNNKELLIYISMAFGNPYRDKWNSEVAIKWVTTLKDEIGVTKFSLADTIGVSNPTNITELFSSLISQFTELEFSAHLHTTPDTWKEKLEAALNSGCSKFEGAFMGYGGCPMAKDKLTGNMPTEHMLNYFSEQDINTNVNSEMISSALKIAKVTFPQ